MKNLSWLYILLILAGCTDMSVEDISINSNEKFYATFEQTDSRTYVDNQIRLRWTVEDCITLFRKTTYNREYMFTGTTGANAGGFRQKSVDDDFWYGADVPYNYAIYPHSSTTQLDETDYFFTFTMPDEQIYAENSFGLGANTMVAVSESGQLTFKNVGSYLRVRLYGEDVSVSSITLTSKGNEAIAGTAKITPSKNGNPTCEMIGTDKSIRLTCPEPVTISTDANNPTDFWIVVPPVTLESGFSVTVENSTGDTQVFDVDKSFTFDRNMYTDMKREVTILEKTIPYLTFKADAEQTLTISNAVETLEYSVNDGEWKELGTNIVNFGGNYGKLQLRGKSSNGTASYNSIQFGNNNLVTCSGDIRTLVDYENYDITDTSNARFMCLFSDCKVLKSAPRLPATSLATKCYEYMFSGCTSLTTAPELPATKLTEDCYANMFQNCTSLISAPDLNAITLADRCYYSMFSECKNLTIAPKLPAIALARGCYAGMFSGCTSLTTTPQLPATTLAPACYSDMFSYCTKLTIVSKLPATNLDNSCYAGMFSGCTSLTTAPQLPATILKSYCYSHMFNECTNLTTAPELPAIDLNTYCYYGMFSNCTSLTVAPELPAERTKEGCYAEMFINCKNLNKTPKLHADIVNPLAYYRMFKNCSKVNTITMLATSFTIGNACTEWLDGVASVGIIIKSPNVTYFPTYLIPKDWTIIDYEDNNTFEDDGPPPVDDGGSII